VLRFATLHCNADSDLKQAAAVLGDLFRLTGIHYDKQPFAERALALLLAHWPAVEALASELVEQPLASALPPKADMCGVDCTTTKTTTRAPALHTPQCSAGFFFASAPQACQRANRSDSGLYRASSMSACPRKRTCAVQLGMSAKGQ